MKKKLTALAIILSILCISVTYADKKNLLLGLYGGYKTHQKNYFQDFDFAIYQLNFDRTPINEIIKKSEIENYEIIWRIPLPKNNSRTNPPSAELWSKLIIDKFKKISKFKKTKISLYEETVPWGKWKDLLIKTYHIVKLELPEVEICQWYSNTKKDSAPGRTVWPILPADCLIWDQYHYDKAQYEKYVSAIATDFPNIKKYSIVWLSPNWEYGPTKRLHNNNFWSKKTGKKRTNDQIKINQEYNIATAFFAYALTKPTQENTKPVLLNEGGKRDQLFWTAFKKKLKDIKVGRGNNFLPKYDSTSH
jgi:hypothetical protein